MALKLKTVFQKVAAYLRYEGRGPLSYLKAYAGTQRDWRIKNLVQIAQTNVMTNKGNTAFLECAMRGNLKAVQAMVEQGIDINQLGYGKDTGPTAVIHAIVGGHEEMLRYLIGKGADMTKGRDIIGMPPVDTARFYRGDKFEKLVQDALTAQPTVQSAVTPPAP